MKSVNTFSQQVVLSIAAVLSGVALSAQTLTLETGQYDLRAGELRQAPNAPLANTQRDTVSFTARAQAGAVAMATTPFVASSREFRTQVSADELQRGITLRTTGDSAVITLSPRSSVKGAGLSPLDLSVQTPDGNVLRGVEAMDQHVDQRALQATGVPFSNGMIGFRLNRALGHGEFVLKSQSKAPASHYLLHVLDTNGAAELTLGAPGQVLVGQNFVADGRFEHEGDDVATIRSASAFMLRPDGERLAAQVEIQGAGYAVTAQADKASSFADGLWELHVTAFDANGVQRDVKTAFAAAYPTARLDGSLTQTSALTFEFGLQSASAGRYEVGAMLYGMKNGEPVAVATSATATWVERGADTLTLTFNPKQVAAAGVEAPFTLRHVTLKDQSRMAVLERIASSSAF